MIEKTFNTGTVNLNYVETSPGGTPLLLLHGYALRWQSLAKLIPDLEEDYHVYALDLRGRGKSDRSDSYRMQDYMTDIAAFIENCIKEPAILFGHSLGGMISVMVAANYPGHVKGIILGDSVLSQEFLKQFSEGHKDVTAFWRQLANTESIETITTELKNQLMPVPGRQELIPAYQVMGEDNPFFDFMATTLSQMDPKVLTADIDHFDETFSEYRTEELFPKIQCPVLLMQGDPELGGLMRDEDVKFAMSLLPKGNHINSTFPLEN